MGRQSDRSFISWLRRFGHTCSNRPAEDTALAQRLLALAAVDLGELSGLAKEIGERLLTQPTVLLEENSAINKSPPTPQLTKRREPLSEIEQQVEFYLQQGKTAFYRSDFLGVLAACDAVLSIEPDDYQALSNKAASLAELGRYEKAIAACDAAISIKPEHHQDLSNKGFSLAHLGRYEEAIAACDAAISIKPEYHQAWLNRGTAASSSRFYQTSVIFSLPANLQDSSLDERDYKGEIACYTIGLRHVQPSQNPEGWGLLHYETGRAHYFHGRFLPNSHIYLAQAASAYKTALTTLTDFPQSHLAVLQDAIRAYLGLANLEKVKACREQGLEVFRQLLNNAESPAHRQHLEQKFSGFSQLQVDTLIRETNPTLALETAERYKNRTISWILDTWQEQISSPSWVEMKSLLASATAILYWHLSPDSLTTFLLTANTAEPIVISVQPIAELKTWLKK